MFFERTGMEIPRIVTVMTIDHEEPKVFIKNAADYIDSFIEIRKKVPF